MAGIRSTSLRFRVHVRLEYVGNCRRPVRKAEGEEGRERPEQDANMYKYEVAHRQQKTGVIWEG